MPASGGQDVEQRNVRLGVYGGLGGVQGWLVFLFLFVCISQRFFHQIVDND